MSGFAEEIEGEVRRRRSRADLVRDDEGEARFRASFKAARGGEPESFPPYVVDAARQKWNAPAAAPAPPAEAPPAAAAGLKAPTMGTDEEALSNYLRKRGDPSDPYTQEAGEQYEAESKAFWDKQKKGLGTFATAMGGIVGAGTAIGAGRGVAGATSALAEEAAGVSLPAPSGKVRGAASFADEVAEGLRPVKAAVGRGERGNAINVAGEVVEATRKGLTANPGLEKIRMPDNPDIDADYALVLSRAKAGAEGDIAAVRARQIRQGDPVMEAEMLKVLHYRDLAKRAEKQINDGMPVKIEGGISAAQAMQEAVDAEQRLRAMPGGDAYFDEKMRLVNDMRGEMAQYAIDTKQMGPESVREEYIPHYTEGKFQDKNLPGMVPDSEAQRFVQQARAVGAAERARAERGLNARVLDEAAETRTARRGGVYGPQQYVAPRAEPDDDALGHYRHLADEPDAVPAIPAKPPRVMFGEGQRPVRHGFAPTSEDAGTFAEPGMLSGPAEARFPVPEGVITSGEQRAQAQAELGALPRELRGGPGRGKHAPIPGAAGTIMERGEKFAAGSTDKLVGDPLDRMAVKYAEGRRRGMMNQFAERLKPLAVTDDVLNGAPFDPTKHGIYYYGNGKFEIFPKEIAVAIAKANQYKEPSFLQKTLGSLNNVARQGLLKYNPSFLSKQMADDPVWGAINVPYGEKGRVLVDAYKNAITAFHELGLEDEGVPSATLNEWRRRGTMNEVFETLVDTVDEMKVISEKTKRGAKLGVFERLGQAREAGTKEAAFQAWKRLGANEESAARAANRASGNFIYKSPLGKELGEIFPMQKWYVNAVRILTKDFAKDPITGQRNARGLSSSPASFMVPAAIAAVAWNASVTKGKNKDFDGLIVPGTDYKVKFPGFGSLLSGAQKMVARPTEEIGAKVGAPGQVFADAFMRREKFDPLKSAERFVAPLGQAHSIVDKRRGEKSGMADLLKFLSPASIENWKKEDVREKRIEIKEKRARR